MRRIISAYYFICGAALVTILLSYSAYASPLSATISQNGGRYTYTYTITNDTGTTLDGFELNGLPEDTNLEQSPEDWDAFALPPSNDSVTVSWSTLVDAKTVANGNQLSGFVISSTLGPGTIDYILLTTSANELKGTIVGPAVSVPEPTAGHLLIVAVFAFVFVVMVARRRTAI